jgi:hypothetical protein
MTVPARSIQPGDLLFGEDHDFVVNAYIALLGRWPDDAGYAHYIAAIHNQPERRVEVLHALAGSEEARRPGRVGPAVIFPEGPILPSDPRHALTVALDLRTGFLRAEVERLREGLELVSGPGGAELAGLGSELLEAREAELRSEIAAVRREMQERLDGIIGLLRTQGALPEGAADPAATAEERIAQALSRTLADYVGDLIAVAETRFEARLRAIEARLLARDAAPR